MKAKNSYCQLIAVDFDGTLCEDNGGKHLQLLPGNILPPDGPKPHKYILDLVRCWSDSTDWEVQIFTARVGKDYSPREAADASLYISAWLQRYLGFDLVITSEKSRRFKYIIDDRAFPVNRHNGTIGLWRQLPFADSLWLGDLALTVIKKLGVDAGKNNHQSALLKADLEDSKAKSLASENLAEAAATFAIRNATYGNSFKRFGSVLAALFPEGLTLKTVDDWNRMGVFFHIADKLSRYAHALPAGGHKDSAHDIIPYAAMLEELTNESKSK